MRNTLTADPSSIASLTDRETVTVNFELGEEPEPAKTQIVVSLNESNDPKLDSVDYVAVNLKGSGSYTDSMGPGKYTSIFDVKPGRYYVQGNARITYDGRNISPVPVDWSASNSGDAVTVNEGGSASITGNIKYRDDDESVTEPCINITNSTKATFSSSPTANCAITIWQAGSSSEPLPGTVDFIVEGEFHNKSDAAGNNEKYSATFTINAGERLSNGNVSTCATGALKGATYEQVGSFKIIGIRPQKATQYNFCEKYSFVP